MTPKKHPFSFVVNNDLAEKFNAMVTYCGQHGVRCSDGLVFRALIGEMELGPVLVGVVRARKERELAERREVREGKPDAPRSPRAKKSS